MAGTRITSIFNDDGVTLIFSDTPYTGARESIRLNNSKTKSIAEALWDLYNELDERLIGPVVNPLPRGIVEVEIVEPFLALAQGHELEVELDGDEDDEDLSLYEEVIETPYQYLEGLGII